MGQARETMDRITQAIMAGDGDALRRLYADDAVAEAPDAGHLRGGEAIVEYMMSFRRAFPDLSWEAGNQYESGDAAVDEGHLVGTHTGTLRGAEGEVPATGKRIRVRECDVITVRDGKAVSHRFYYDRLDLASQLGLTASGTAAVPTARTGTDRPSQAAPR